jgi:hypothetical protein
MLFVVFMVFSCRETAYLSYSSRYADLLFELISRRHEQKSTLITINKSFAEWSEVFPNAACVVALVDRLVHHAEIIGIKGQSYRQKEAQEQAKARAVSVKPHEGMASAFRLVSMTTVYGGFHLDAGASIGGVGIAG